MFGQSFFLSEFGDISEKFVMGDTKKRVLDPVNNSLVKLEEGDRKYQKAKRLGVGLSLLSPVYKRLGFTNGIRLTWLRCWSSG